MSAGDTTLARNTGSLGGMGGGTAASGLDGADPALGELDALWPMAILLYLTMPACAKAKEHRARLLQTAQPGHSKALQVLHVHFGWLVSQKGDIVAAA